MGKRVADMTPEEREEVNRRARERLANMTEEQKQRRKEYLKKYYEKHKEDIKEYRKKYDIDHRQEINKRAREYYKNNKGKFRDYHRNYNAKESSKEIKKKWRQRPENKHKCHLYRIKNKEKIQKQQKEALYCNKNLFSKWGHRLSIDEKPLPDADGFLTVVDFHTGERFYPTLQQIKTRIRCLNGSMSGECHLYKNQDNKEACAIYRRRKYIRGNENYYVKGQVNKYWRDQVISRANGYCERCGKESEKLIAHHLAPRATCAFDGDIDNGMALCLECHREVHSTDGCRLHELAAEKRETA